MNLVRFLLIGAFLAVGLGEFAKYPFGAVGNSVSFLDLGVALTGVFFLIWKVGIKKQLDFPKHYVWLLAFFLIGGLSLLWNQNFSGVLYLIRFFLYSLIFWIGFSLVEEKFWLQIQKVILASGVGLAITGFLQLMFFPNLDFLTDYGYDPHIWRLSGTFFDPNFLGAYLSFTYALGLILYLHLKEKKYLFCLLVLFMAIILTFSRSAWLMFGILQLFVLWRLPKKILMAIVILSLLAVTLIPRVQDRVRGAFQVDISASERFSSWEKGYQLFSMSPILGIGFNNIRSVSLENNLLKPFSADGGNSGAGVDSSWLLILATTGVTGLIVFGWFYFYLTLLFLKKFFSDKTPEGLILAGLLVGFFVNAQFINSLFYPPLMLVFFLWIGGYYAASQEDK